MNKKYLNLFKTGSEIIAIMHINNNKMKNKIKLKLINNFNNNKKIFNMGYKFWIPSRILTKNYRNISFFQNSSYYKNKIQFIDNNNYCHLLINKI